MITNKNNNHCTSKFPLTTILPYTEIAYFPWLFNDFTDFPFSFLIFIVSLENSSLILMPFQLFGDRKGDLLSFKTRKLGNYCSWRGVIAVTYPVTSFNI